MLRFVVIGYGIQGKKRKNLMGDQCAFIVDPISDDADFANIEDVPLEEFDGAFVCTPDNEKFQIIKYLVNNKKHVLCEKPLSFQRLENFHYIQAKAQDTGTTLYTAYNHRFEASISRAKQIIESKLLGEIYLVRLFYGNGTAKLVANSNWRDSGIGVISDLGSHCIDIIRNWFPSNHFTMKLSEVCRFENRAPDYAVMISRETSPKIIVELSLCSWKNQFRAEIVGEKGSLNLDGLKKWGQSSLVTSERVYPSGYPLEYFEYFEPGDETWKLENDHFIKLIRQSVPANLENDIFIFNVLHEELMR